LSPRLEEAAACWPARLSAKSKTTASVSLQTGTLEQAFIERSTMARRRDQNVSFR
jgi:hypothetical protein